MNGKVGMEAAIARQSNFASLETVCVANDVVGSWDAMGVQSLCPSLTHLDMSHNQLSEWPLPLPLSLRSLDLGCNPLHLSVSLPFDTNSVSTNLRSLGVTRCNLSWTSLIGFLCHTPSLNVLDVSGNNALSLIPDTLFRTVPMLTHLYLCDCGIDTW
jgi:Leucine-rich repeat (LRR) protein